MTKREFLNQVVAAQISEEMTAFAQAEIEKMDKTNSRAMAKAEEKRAAKAPLREAVLAVLGNEPLTREQIVELIPNAEELGIKATGIASLLKPLVEDGTVVKEKVKMEKSDKTGYKLA